MLYKRYKHKTLNHKVILMLVFGMAFSQSFAQYEIKKHTINSGGTTSTGGDYQVSGSIGQTDASGKLTGGDYSLNGGFWSGTNDLIFKSGFE